MTDDVPTEPDGRPTDPAAVPPLAFRVALSVTSMGAAAIHFAVLGEHLDHYVLFGLFFAVIAWLQAAWAVAVVAAPTRRLLMGGLLGNVVVVAIWGVSRTWGVPIGPEAGVPEAASLIDIMARYQDVDVAFAEGWQDDGTDWPEVGSHFYRDGDWDESFPARPGVDLADPEFLMYSKLLTGRWKLVAVAYVVDQALYPEPPTDLTGALYHEHVWNCIDDGEELEEEDWGVISKEECQIVGGVWSPGAVWMTHVWFIDNPDGVFGEVNPSLVATA